MLKFLQIRNFALMEDISMEFEEGLTVVTGETGAGKSMIVSAIASLCGTRIDDDAIRTGKRAAEITGIFDVGPSIRGRLEESGIGSENEMIIRRNIEKGKRQNCYINDRMVSLNFLRDIARHMVDLIGQHENQSLFDKRNHLTLLDAYAGLDGARNEYADMFNEYRGLQNKLKMLLEEIEARDERIDYLKFQIDEIKKVNLQPNEEEELNLEKNLLSTSEKRSLLSRAIVEDIYEQDGSVIEKLARIGKSLEELAALDPQLKENSEQIAGVLSTIDEVYRVMSSYHDKIDFSQERLDFVIGRLETINRMKKKYGKSVDEINGYLKRMEDELAMIETRDEEIEKTKKKISEVQKMVRAQAESLSSRRHAAAVDLRKKILRMLKQLGMEKADFDIRFGEVDVNALGRDEVEFYISTNPGEELKPLIRIASGGEISRITLCLKAMLSDVDDIPTVIFDEVDIGIGGRIAEAVGNMLAGVSKKHQVICITHLPQIPTFADNHMLVKKEIKGDATHSMVVKLDEAKRKLEIARMLAGKEITTKTVDHAAEMLQKGKRK
ncbi:MAG: DNA repair protein RecN [candidate division WOR-3 bacterium]|nr:MAG: DNA repair protein RecN [candidate division WOR-3 bacterium]